MVLGEEVPRSTGRLVPRGWDRAGPGVLRLWGFMGRKEGHKEGVWGGNRSGFHAVSLNPQAPEGGL